LVSSQFIHIALRKKERQETVSPRKVSRQTISPIPLLSGGDAYFPIIVIAKPLSANLKRAFFGFLQQLQQHHLFVEMSSSSFWSDACFSAFSTPLKSKLDSLYASCGIVVRPLDTAYILCGAAMWRVRLQYSQIILYLASSAAGGIMFYLWRRMIAADRRRVWIFYGCFHIHEQIVSPL